MASLNKWIGIGNNCNEVELKYMPSGGAVANLSIACNESYKDKTTGQKVEKTEFVRVVFFNRLAEIVGEYVKKGDPLYIEGNLRTRSWEDNGIKKYSTEIVAREMQMLGSKSGSDTSASQQARPQQGSYQQQRKQPVSSQAPQQHQAPQNFDNFDDDIPF